jgi:cysteine synthase
MHSSLVQVFRSFPLLPTIQIAFCTGTGGTIAGVGRFIKSKNEDVIVALTDPEGSGLYNKVRTLGNNHLFARYGKITYSIQVKFGVMYDPKESEGTKRRHQVDTVVEGMCVVSYFSVYSDIRIFFSGINRITNNISLALPIIDDAFR